MRALVVASLSLNVILLVGAPPSAATKYIVRPDGSGDFPTVQAAIEATVDGDIVELTDGTFTGFGNRDIVFRGRAITIRSRSGDPTACIIDCEGSEIDPHRGVSFINGEGPGSVLEGVTITNVWLGEAEAGGAVRCRFGSSPTLASCRFMDCVAGSATGIWCQNSSPVIRDCVFEGNSAVHGAAGLFCTDSSPTIERCVFLNNTSQYEAGAVVCNFTAAPTLVDCIFSGNSCPDAAAIRCEAAASPTLTRCTLTHNFGGSGGGVIRCRQDASVTLVNSVIAFDDAAQAIVCSDNGSATLTCCDLYGNAGGDWIDCIANQLGIEGNFSADPQFCSTAPGIDAYWVLQSDSPCVPGNHPGGVACGLIGASAITCGPSGVEPTTWGTIKAQFDPPEKIEEVSPHLSE